MKKIIVFISILTFINPIFVFGLADDKDKVCIKNQDNDTCLSEKTNDISLIPNATSGVLMEVSSGKIIFEKNINKEVAVASMTKMMAQIIILENIENGNIKWDDIVTVNKEAADMGGSQIYIEQGEKISIYDLMRGISMASANDATVQMAYVISGSEEKFVKLMNKKAKEMGLKHTYFKNCTGLDEDGHFSSAGDMAMIARELIVKHPKILDFSSVYEGYLRENTVNKFWLVNTNKLVRYYEGADGLKTGHTDAAKYCLAVTAKRNNLRLIGIVLGEENSKIRNNEVMGLLDYGFNNLSMKILRNKGETIKKIKLDKASKSIISIKLQDNLGVLTKSVGKNKKYKYSIKINDIKLPIKKGKIVGEVKVLDNDSVVARQNLIIDDDIGNLSFFNLLGKSFLDIISGVI